MYTDRKSKKDTSWIYLLGEWLVNKQAYPTVFWLFYGEIKLQRCESVKIDLQNNNKKDKTYEMKKYVKI